METAVVLDFDGTTVDTMPRLSELATEIICKQYSIAEIAAKEHYWRTIGLPFRDQLREIFGSVNEEAVVEFESRKEEITLTAEIFEQVNDLLHNRSKDLMLAIVSSTRTELVRRYFAQRNILPLVDWLSGIEHGNKAIQIQSFCSRWLIKPSDVIFFGDADKDALFAKEAGVKFEKVINGKLRSLPLAAF